MQEPKRTSSAMPARNNAMLAHTTAMLTHRNAAATRSNPTLTAQRKLTQSAYASLTLPHSILNLQLDPSTPQHSQQTAHPQLQLQLQLHLTERSSQLFLHRGADLMMRRGTTDLMVHTTTMTC
jgi:hypothetical protein